MVAGKLIFVSSILRISYNALVLQMIREPKISEKESYDKVVSHSLQSWEWGEFREKTGVKAIRRAIFKGPKLSSGFQLTIHRVPYTKYTIGYFPKGPLPTKEILKELEKVGKEFNCIFIKLEPNVPAGQKPATNDQRLTLSPRPLFTKYTFQIDLTKSEEELTKQMKEKTRYNVRLAQKQGVTVKEDNSPEAFENYLRLTKETTQRQKFYAHTERYHRLMWETLHPAGIAHLLVTSYQNRPLVTWIVFNFNNVLYYPYGASSTEHRELMASNLIMWEAIKFGKKIGCTTFDLWGALGPEPDKNDPWYGFHRFKEGYGGKLVEFIGTYDLVLKPTLYKLYNLADNLRWGILRLRKLFV